MSANNLNVEALVKAHNEGFNEAASIKLGDTFLGAHPAAEARGHDIHSTSGRMFVCGYLNGLDKAFPNGIKINMDTNAVVSKPCHVAPL